MSSGDSSMEVSELHISAGFVLEPDQILHIARKEEDAPFSPPVRGTAQETVKT